MPDCFLEWVEQCTKVLTFPCLCQHLALPSILKFQPSSHSLCPPSPFPSLCSFSHPSLFTLSPSPFTLHLSQLALARQGLSSKGGPTGDLGDSVVPDALLLFKETNIESASPAGTPTADSSTQLKPPCRSHGLLLLVPHSVQFVRLCVGGLRPVLGIFLTKSCIAL